MTSIAFAFLCMLFIWASYKISHHMINIASVFTVPYMLIVPLNNLWMGREGFYKISDQTILMILASLSCIFAGTILANLKQRNVQSVQVKTALPPTQILQYYDFSKMQHYVFCVEAIVTVRVLYILGTRGISYIVASEFEGMIIRGPIGHLLLTIYPLAPIQFYYWLKNKKEVKYLLSFLLCCAFLFLSLVKYHMVGIIVLTFLLVSLQEEKYVKKGVIIVSAFAIGFFTFNYVLTFALRGVISNVSQKFYFHHVWNYMAGSLIHDNYIFTDGRNVGMTSFYKYIRVILTPVNSLMVSFWGKGITPIETVTHAGGEYVSLGTNGEYGNVLDAFGYFYPSKGNMLEIIFSFVLLIIVGWAFSLIYKRAIARKNEFKITISAVLTFFCFFSFFGTFYLLLPAWEVLVYSIIIPKLFDHRFKIKWHS